MIVVADAQAEGRGNVCGTVQAVRGLSDPGDCFPAFGRHHRIEDEERTEA